MRWLLACTFPLVFAACGDKDGDDTSGSSGDDTAADGIQPPWGSDNCPEEVPEQYRASWDCKAAACGGDTKMYRHGEGASDAEGNLAVTETYFLFFGEDDDYDWCWDSFDITGSVSSYSVEDFNCTSCESIFDIRWKMSTDNQCRLLWGSLFIDDEDEEDGPFTGVMMFDTHNSFGDRNPDDAMLVYGNFIDGGYYYPDNSYGKGTATPTSGEEEQIGPPEDYEYINSGVCLGSSSN